MMNEIAQALALIDVYRSMAQEAKEAGDTTTSALYTKAANAVEAQLGAAQPKLPTAPGTREVREAAPREEGMATPPPEGM